MRLAADMFAGRAWAEAFINTLESEGCKIEEGIEALEIFAPLISSLRGIAFGSSAAERMEVLLREGMKKAGVSSPAYETALRFIILMVRKNAFRRIGSVLVEAKKILDRKNRIVRIVVEYAAAPGEDAAGAKSAKFMDEGRVKELIKKRSGAAGVEMVMRNNKELLGGYRLRIGDEIIDASVRSQLKKLAASLATGDGGIDGK
jgi:F-type H+-transporting ATPase subunit delta